MVQCLVHFLWATGYKHECLDLESMHCQSNTNVYISVVVCITHELFVYLPPLHLSSPVPIIITPAVVHQVIGVSMSCAVLFFSITLLLVVLTLLIRLTLLSLPRARNAKSWVEHFIHFHLTVYPSFCSSIHQPIHLQMSVDD